MSDTTEDTTDKGFRINARGISCIPCRCKRQFYHKETKTTKENNITITNTIIDKRSTKFGSSGRHTSPDDIFKPDTSLQEGSVEICDTGWGKSQITPEELEERLERVETDIDLMKKDIDETKKDIEDINKSRIKMDERLRCNV